MPELARVPPVCQARIYQMRIPEVQITLKADVGRNKEFLIYETHVEVEWLLLSV